MKQTSDVKQEVAGRSRWVTPELSRMSVEQTLSGKSNFMKNWKGGRPPHSFKNGS